LIAPPSAKILFVDDDAAMVETFQQVALNRFNADTALGGEQALDLIRRKGPYAVLISDMSMPGMNGVQFLEQAQKLSPDAVRIMVTGNLDQRTAVDAVNRGQIFRFLNKPFALSSLVLAIELALKHYEMLRAERELLEGTLMGSVKAMAEVIGLVAPDVLGLGRRLQESMRQFGSFVGAGPSWELEVAALLSPLGSAALPLRLRQKVASRVALAPDEAAMAQRSPQVAHDLLAPIPRLGNVARIVLHQDHAYTGSGFPEHSPIREDLPIGARMLKILKDRLSLEDEGRAKKLPYAGVKQRSHEAMKRRAGQYDPQLLERCFDCFQAYLGTGISEKRGVQSLFLVDVVPEQIVVSDICTTEGVVLVSAGSRLTPVVIEHLRNHAEMGGVTQPVLVQDPEAL
jgi:response regulator RpfG family c-di-GMP phosphodiesterase